MEQPIYIIGTPRSGTTLTSKILGKHTRLFMPGETHFFEDIYSIKNQLGENFNIETKKKIIHRLSTIYGRYNQPSDQARIDHVFSDPKNIQILISKWNSYKDVLTSFMELQMNEMHKQRWGNNVPRDIFNYEDILSFFPNAKIIICVRDVRDFLLSYKGKWRITIPENIEYLKKIYHPVTTSLLWKTSINMIPILKKRFPSRNLMVSHYEKIVEDPESIVKIICKFIGEEFEPQMLHIDDSNSSHQNDNKGIFATSVGKWRKKLPAEEAYISQQILKKELKHFGYEVDNIKVNYLKVIYILSTFPYAFLRALNLNRKKKEAFIPYLIRRLKSFF